MARNRAAALAVGGVGLQVLLLAPLAQAAPAPRLSAVGAVRMVSPVDHDMTEFQVARDPRDPKRLAVAAIDLEKTGAHAGCMTYLSADGGASWAESNPLMRLPGGDRALSADPMVVFDRRGRLHVVCLLPEGGTGNPLQLLRTVYVRSDDLGGSWTVPRDVPTVDPASSADKPALLVTRTGRIVVCALQGVDGDGTPFSGRSTTAVAVSDDDAATWKVFEPPMLAGYAASCVSLSADSQDRLHMAFESLGGEKATPGTLAAVNSRDQGLTWSEPVIISKKPYLKDPPEGTAYPFASMADSNPAAPAVYAAGTTATPDRRWQLTLARSADGGRSYQPLRPPAPPSAACRRHMRNPVVHVDDRGRVALEFSCRDQLRTDEGIREAWISASTDGGRTWLPPVLLAREPAPKCATPYVAGQVNQVDTCWRFADGADYWFLTSTPAGFHAFWTDATTGDHAIRTQVFRIEQPAATQPTLPRSRPLGATIPHLPSTGLAAPISAAALMLLLASLAVALLGRRGAQQQ